MFSNIGVQLRLAPIGQGVEFHLMISRLYNRQAQAVTAMKALAARDPRIELGQGAVKRQHLTHVTTGVRVSLPKLGGGISDG